VPLALVFERAVPPSVRAGKRTTNSLPICAPPLCALTLPLASLALSLNDLSRAIVPGLAYLEILDDRSVAAKAAWFAAYVASALPRSDMLQTLVIRSGLLTPHDQGLMDARCQANQRRRADVLALVQVVIELRVISDIILSYVYHERAVRQAAASPASVVKI